MKLLIVAGPSAAQATELPVGVALLVERASEIAVMSPSMVSRLQWLTGEIDAARRLADDRVTTIVERLEAGGVPASGLSSDELRMDAFDDAMSQFSPDHVLIAFSGTPDGSWQRNDLADELLQRYRLPVTVFVSAPAPHR